MTETFGPKNLQDLLQSAQQMQEEIKRVQDSLGSITVEGMAAGGMVKAVANGRQQLVSLTIEPALFDSKDVEMMQDLVVGAVNQALAKASEAAQQEMGKVTGQMNLNLGGLF